MRMLDRHSVVRAKFRVADLAMRSPMAATPLSLPASTPTVDMADRAALAAPLLLQSPPGQVPNVYEDLAGLVASEGDSARADSNEFKKLAAKVREEHNLQQHIVVDLPDGKGKSVLCASAAHPSGTGRFLAPRQQIIYSVNHETLTTSDSKSYKPNAQVESFRSHLESLLSIYLEDRYETGIVGVFAVPLPRVEVPVNEEVVEKAKDAEEDKAVSPVKVTSVAVADDAIESQKEEVDQTMDEGEDKADSPQANPEEEKTGDEVMEDVKDDPVETAKAMEEVQGDKEGTSSSPKAPATSEEDNETEGETKIVIHIVANRYKLSNFWTGRWRSRYTLSSPTATQVDGQVNVLIHYFEEGNVQLNSSKSEQLTLSSESSEEARCKAIVKAIETFESKYQEELFNTCNELGDGAFRSLRRQLPMTKQKMDWDRVLNYNIGSELGE